MSKDAIFETTMALKARLEALPELGASTVHVGLPTDVGDHRVWLFLYNVTPNRELRNSERVRRPTGGAPPNAAARPVDALPLDLRYLISVFRAGNAEPRELKVLGAVMQSLHTEPTLSGVSLEGQTVRVTPEPYPVEELNRIWGMFPEDSYRTSVVYLASPVYIESDLALGPPVQLRRLRQGISDDSAEPPA